MSEPPNGQGLAAASRPNCIAFKLESSVKITPISRAEGGRLEHGVGRQSDLTGAVDYVVICSIIQPARSTHAQVVARLLAD